MTTPSAGLDAAGPGITKGLPLVEVVLTGGTMDSVGRDRLDLASYYETRQRTEETQPVKRVASEIARFAEIETLTFGRLESHGMTTADLIRLAQLLKSRAATDSDGIVVTHGTNTLEETAFFLSLIWSSPKPLILVGAMRPSSALSSDADLNLVRGVQVASSEEARGRGVLVVMNDEIYAARDVTKSATYRVNAFCGGDLGPLGFADADSSVIFYHGQERWRPARFDVDVLTELPRVDIVVSYLGADGQLIDAAVRAGAKGIVSSGTGSGRPTPSELEALRRARMRGVAVCQASRVGRGRVTKRDELVRDGFIWADNLQPWKARILLALGLTTTSDPVVLRQLFEAY